MSDFTNFQYDHTTFIKVFWRFWIASKVTDSLRMKRIIGRIYFDKSST